MFNTNTLGTSNGTNKMADQTASTVDQAIQSTKRVTNDALDNLSGRVEGLRRDAAPLLNRVSEQASTIARRSVDGVRESSQQLRDKALRASDNTVSYIRDEPVKSILIAAATGAALMAVMSLLSGSRRHD